MVHIENSPLSCRRIEIKNVEQNLSGLLISVEFKIEHDKERGIHQLELEFAVPFDQVEKTALGEPNGPSRKEILDRVKSVQEQIDPVMTRTKAEELEETIEQLRSEIGRSMK